MDWRPALKSTSFKNPHLENQEKAAPTLCPMAVLDNEFFVSLIVPYLYPSANAALVSRVWAEQHEKSNYLGRLLAARSGTIDLPATLNDYFLEARPCNLTFFELYKQIESYGGIPRRLLRPDQRKLLRYIAYKGYDVAAARLLNEGEPEYHGFERRMAAFMGRYPSGLAFLPVLVGPHQLRISNHNWIYMHLLEVEVGEDAAALISHKIAYNVVGKRGMGRSLYIFRSFGTIPMDTGILYVTQTSDQVLDIWHRLCRLRDIPAYTSENLYEIALCGRHDISSDIGGIRWLRRRTREMSVLPTRVETVQTITESSISLSGYRAICFCVPMEAGLSYAISLAHSMPIIVPSSVWTSTYNDPEKFSPPRVWGN